MASSTDITQKNLQVGDLTKTQPGTPFNYGGLQYVKDAAGNIAPYTAPSPTRQIQAPAPQPVTTSPNFSLDANITYPSSVFSEKNQLTFADLMEAFKTSQQSATTQYQPYLDKIKKIGEDYAALQAPSQAEIDLQNQISGLQTQEAQMQAAAALKGTAEVGTGAPLGVSEAYRTEVGREAAFARVPIDIKLQTLSTQLGLQQQMREAQAAVQQGLLSSTEAQTQVSAQVQQQASAQFDQFLKMYTTLQAQQQTQLSAVLNSLQGVDPNTISATYWLQIAQLAPSLGLTADMIKGGLQASYTKSQADFAATRASTAKTETQVVKSTDAFGNPIELIYDFAAKRFISAGGGGGVPTGTPMDTTTVPGRALPQSPALQYATTYSVGGNSFTFLDATKDKKAIKGILAYAQKNNFDVVTSASQANDLVNIADANRKLDGQQQYLQGLLPNGALQRDLGGAGLNSLESYLQTDSDKAAYKTWLDASLDLAKAMSGTQGFRGNQTFLNQIRESMPMITDTLSTANRKLGVVRGLINDRLRALLPKWGAAQDKIDQDQGGGVGGEVTRDQLIKWEQQYQASIGQSSSTKPNQTGTKVDWSTYKGFGGIFDMFK